MSIADNGLWRSGRSPQEVADLRFIVRIARLYHERGLGQPEIARRLGVSQARVSRVLKRAEALGIVRTTVVVPDGLHAELEGQLEDQYGLTAAYVVGVLSDDQEEVNRSLGIAGAFALSHHLGEARVVGFSSWSSTLYAMAEALPEDRQNSVQKVVELLGGIGNPLWQHQAAHATELVARRLGADPVFLRVPGVVATPELREAVVAQDRFVREALALFESVDVAIIGIGPAELSDRLRRGGVEFTDEQLSVLRNRDIAGNINIRFLDSFGQIVSSPLDELVIGMSLEQLRNAKVKFAVAGGEGKGPSIRAALAGKVVDVLVVDEETATWLLENRH